MERTALPPGTRLGELEIVRVLADGGFGIVYIAHDHTLDREVAVKEFMPIELAVRRGGMHVAVRPGAAGERYAVGLRAFIDEAKLLASFSHPAIVKVYHFWEANGTAYMVMPRLHGPTLADVRRSMNEPPTEAWMRSMIDPLLDALALLHARGVCHRDVAPDNVVVTGSGQPVLLDFGAARRLIGTPLRPVTALVKPSYAPIEQYAEAAHLQQGPWTDLYGLAAMVAYLVDGKPPPEATRRCVYDDMVPLAKRKVPGVSTRFLAAMDWALALRPRDRPHSVGAWREALDGQHGMRYARWRHGLAWGARRTRWSMSAAARGAARHTPAWAPLAATACMLTLLTSSRMVSEVEHVPPARIEESLGLTSAGKVALPAFVAPAQSDPDPLGTFAAALSRPQTSDAKPVADTTTTPSGPTDVKASAATPSSRAMGRHAARAPSKLAVSKTSRIEAIAAGPRELCADRSFFTRAFCVQRLCGETRYERRAECARLPVARNDHY